jgi:hypothetical protein
VVASLSLGSVDSLSAASAGFVFEPGVNPPVNPPVDIPGGGLGPIPGGDLGLPGDNGGAVQPGQQQPAALFGRVAKMPPGALLAAGVVFLIFAVGLAMGPSLRRWRAVT